MRYLVLIMLFFSFSNALKVDVEYLKREISDNPQNIKYRLILVKYFISHGNIIEAKKYLEEASKIDPSNRDLVKYKTKLAEVINFKDYLLDNGISSFDQKDNIGILLDKLFNQKKYHEYISVYEHLGNLNITIDQKRDLQAIKSYLSIGDTSHVRSMLEKNLVQNQSDNFWIKARICLLEKKYGCAKSYYQRLLARSLNEKYFVELFDLAEKNVDSKELELLYHQVKLLFPKRVVSKHITQKFGKYQVKVLESLKSNYYKDRRLKLLQPYAYKLHEIGRADEAIDEIKEFIAINPNNNEAKYLLAKIYSWSGYPQKSISVLAPVIDDNGDSYEMLSFFSSNLYQIGDYKRASFYLNRMLKLTTDKNKILEIKNKLTSIKARRSQSLRESFLSKAIKYHKEKSYKLAILYYEKYYNQTKDKKITKEIAELSFLRDDLQKAEKFYRIYLFNYPSDSFINFRYVTLLERKKEYRKTIPLLKRVIGARDENYYLAKYHLAFNLMLLDNDIDWLESRKVFHSLQDELLSDDHYEGSENMLSLISQALKRVDKARPKASSYKDIMLGAGQNKLIDEDIFYPVNIKIVDSLSTSSLLGVAEKLKNDKPREKIVIDYRSTNDDTIFSSNYGIRGSNIISTSGKQFGASLNEFKIRTNKNEHKATKVALNMRTKNMNISIGFNKFADFTEVVPKIEYSQKVANHNMNFGLSYQNGVFSNYRQQMIESKVKNLQLTFYDAILLHNLEHSEVWAQANIYDNNAQGYSLGFNYPLWKIATDNAQLPFLLNGNYEYNTNPEASYSPSVFYDSNFIDIRPKLSLGSGTYLSGLGGMGYSVDSKDMLFHYGLSSSILLFDMVEFLLNCQHMQSQYSKYGSDECSMNLGYVW